MFGGILRAYQKEVDFLSKRAKTSDGFFLSVYKSFAEAPNPAPLLDIAVGSGAKIAKLQELELENAELRKTLGDYNEEFAEVKNQEATVNRLRKEIKSLEKSLEDEVNRKLESKIESEKDSFLNEIESLREEKKDLEVQLGNAEQKALTYQAKGE